MRVVQDRDLPAHAVLSREDPQGREHTGQVQAGRLETTLRSEGTRQEFGLVAEPQKVEGGHGDHPFVDGAARHVHVGASGEQESERPEHDGAGEVAGGEWLQAEENGSSDKGGAATRESEQEVHLLVLPADVGPGRNT